MKKSLLASAVCLVVIAFWGLACATPPPPAPKAPTTFTRTMEPTWASIEARPELGYENAWNSVVDLLARRFDLEVISKDNGYVRTNWLYTWTGVMSENYRVRVTIKFSPDHSKVEVKSEAQFHGMEGWILGTDEALLQTLKTDIMGTVGRSTR